jgi:hypothetical protein
MFNDEEKKENEKICKLLDVCALVSFSIMGAVVAYYYLLVY